MLSKLKIDHLLGIEALDIDLQGNIVEVTGDNAAGKTSVVKAILAAIAGGHDPSMIRNGAESGAVTIVFDGEMIRRHIGKTKGTTTVKGQGTSPQNYVEMLIDPKAANPV